MAPISSVIFQLFHHFSLDLYCEVVQLQYKVKNALAVTLLPKADAYGLRYFGMSKVVRGLVIKASRCECQSV